MLILLYIHRWMSEVFQARYFQSSDGINYLLHMGPTSAQMALLDDSQILDESMRLLQTRTIDHLSFHFWFDLRLIVKLGGHLRRRSRQALEMRREG